MVIEWLLPVLFHARQRPEMYFSPIGHVAMLHWISGLYAGLDFRRWNRSMLEVPKCRGGTAAV